MTIISLLYNCSVYDNYITLIYTVIQQLYNTYMALYITVIYTVIWQLYHCYITVI